MKRVVMVAVAVSCVFWCSCAGRDTVPESAYDPALIEAARAAAEEDRIARERAEAMQPQPEEEEAPGECNRLTGGCKKGYICWDSWFCKVGFEDQCTAAGDKRCHKLCAGDGDCPEEMPHCREIPIFNGSDRGVLEKFCVSTRRKIER